METKEEKIMSAAQKLFFRHGFRKVTMSDIAEAAELSRPSLYAVFANKEAVISKFVDLHIERNHENTKNNLPLRKSLKEQLDCLFDIWIIDPFASVIDLENGKEMLETINEFAPDATNQVYVEFEKYAVEILKKHMKKKSGLSAKDLAHIMSLATKGLKASSDSLADLRRLVNGLIEMTISAL